VLFSLLEQHFGNGWTNLTRQIGLTDSIILGSDVSIDDDGKAEFNENSKVYWFPNYMVTNYAEEIKAEGKLIFTKNE
jgi:hypothetical protein